jgi:hypothetical protein
VPELDADEGFAVAVARPEATSRLGFGGSGVESACFELGHRPVEMEGELVVDLALGAGAPRGFEPASLGVHDEASFGSRSSTLESAAAVRRQVRVSCSSARRPLAVSA